MKQVHDIVEDSDNEVEVYENNSDAINKELSFNNNISVNGGVKAINVKERNVIQNSLIQIGVDEIGKVTKVKKSNIIDFNAEEEKMEVPGKISEG
jgi:hypothetical protein